MKNQALNTSTAELSAIRKQLMVLPPGSGEMISLSVTPVTACMRGQGFECSSTKSPEEANPETDRSFSFPAGHLSTRHTGFP